MLPPGQHRGSQPVGAQRSRVLPASQLAKICCNAALCGQICLGSAVIDHDKQTIFLEIMFDSAKQRFGLKQRKRQAPGQNCGRSQERKPGRDRICRLLVTCEIGHHELGVRHVRHVTRGVVDACTSVSKQPVTFYFHPDEPIRPKKGIQRRGITEARTPHVTHHAAARQLLWRPDPCGPHPGRPHVCSPHLYRPSPTPFLPGSVQNIQVFIVDHAAALAQALLEVH